MDYLAKANTKPLPPHFAPPESWPEFGALMMPKPICRRETVGSKPLGARWGVWPLFFEEYVSDQEPNLEDSKIGVLSYNRLVIWKRVSRTEVPKGWRQAPLKKSWRIDAYHQLVPNTDYKARWNKKARHDLETWRSYEVAGYTIVQVGFTEFKQAYHKSTVYKTQGDFFIAMLERKLGLPVVSKQIQFWAALNPAKEIIAGTAMHFSTEHYSSMRECPFILPEARACQAATGLMDRWFKEAVNHGSSLLYFTYFWQPGEKKSWRGFSTFKSHFATDYVSYPVVLWRISRGKFW